jgi:long-chain acyl-CoA synthetase
LSAAQRSPVLTQPSTRLAAVALRPGSALSAPELDAHCRERLASWKAPRFIALVEGELPKLANGKPDRLTIRAAADPDRGACWDRNATEEER